MKQYIGISRDHSGSMSWLAKSALQDYNSQVLALQKAAAEHKIDTIVSVTECAGGVNRAVVNSNIAVLQPLYHYSTGGGTPLFDSIGALIELMTAVPDAKDKDVAFLVMAITDGEENQSKHWNAMRLAQKIRELQATDKWTFAFRVPAGGYKRNLASLLGIPDGNITEWEQTERGMERGTLATVTASANYFNARSAGRTYTASFYADLDNVAPKEVKAAMRDLTPELLMWPVGQTDHRTEIKPFVQKRLAPGEAYKVGSAFYQLTKSERVQEHKRVMIRDKNSNAIYEGNAARQLLGVPNKGLIRLSPGKFGSYDLFIQSTSVNRKVDAGTHLLYWKACPDTPPLTWDPASVATATP